MMMMMTTTTTTMMMMMMNMMLTLMVVVDLDREVQETERILAEKDNISKELERAKRRDVLVVSFCQPCPHWTLSILQCFS